ncbi:hypothetical protein GcM3_188046 [Golovinomyces cichoracearum]|uniref:Uncharacterized protein n=1 Tax=Golovinomyces cichoracearum TaxID=62708 RepID=A0A420HIS6_9PEZI|nr:hypothetical protein GcM3_188046 [Golovinomyces cichoracearum]
MDVGRECIFMCYTDTPSQYRVFVRDLHTTIFSSYTKFKEDIKGSTIVDLKLWKESGIDFSEGKGNSAPAIRKPIGRPKITLKQIEPSSLSYNTEQRKFKTDNSAEDMKNLGLVNTDKLKALSPILNELNDAGKLRKNGTVEFTSSDVIPSLEKSINFNDENVASVQTEDNSQIITADKENQELSQSQGGSISRAGIMRKFGWTKIDGQVQILTRKQTITIESKKADKSRKIRTNFK